VSSGGLAVKHPALGGNGHRFDPSKRSKLFQRLISRLTTSWVADHVKWHCRLHLIIKIKGGIKDPLRGISAPSFRTAPPFYIGTIYELFELRMKSRLAFVTSVLNGL